MNSTVKSAVKWNIGESLIVGKFKNQQGSTQLPKKRNKTKTKNETLKTSKNQMHSNRVEHKRATTRQRESVFNFPKNYRQYKSETGLNKYNKSVLHESKYMRIVFLVVENFQPLFLVALSAFDIWLCNSENESHTGTKPSGQPIIFLYTVLCLEAMLSMLH